MNFNLFYFMISERNRFFSSILNTDKSHSAYVYKWNDNAIITGHAAIITGAWVPEGASIITPSFARLTGSQTQIPAGSTKWSISVVSGGAFINGVGPFIAGYNLNGGGYGMALSTPINVGTTGGLTYVNWEG